MKILAALASLTAAVASHAQEDTTLRRLLRACDANQFYTYAASFADSPTIHRSLLLRDQREIAPGFEESAAVYEHYVKITDTPHVTQHVYGYTIHLITEGSRIIFYRLHNADFEVGARSITPDHFSDSARWNVLRQRYRQMFTVELDTTRLFSGYGMRGEEEDEAPMVVYAAGCGFGNEPPELRDTTEKAIRQGDRQRMFSWLTQPNSEMQLYAMEAYYRMRKWWKTSGDERRIIRYIKTKKGTVVSCSYCIVGESLEIKSVCRKFKFGW